MKRSLVLLALLVSGCVVAPGARVSQVPEQEELFGVSVEGREIRGSIFGKSGPTYFLFAVIHGDEPMGEPLLRRFMDELRARPDLVKNRRIVVIPVINPDGLARKSRRNVHGVDLNRNFAARNFKPSEARGPTPESEPESRVVAKVIRQFSPKRIMAVHAPYHCVNFDGPAEPLARKLAQASGYELKPSIGYPTPGSLGSWAGIDLEIPTITLELPDPISAERAWSDMRQALEIFVTP